ncbi:ABC transporter C family member 10-like [Fagus crenata]
MEDLWTVFCGGSGCSDSSGKPCGTGFEFLSHPSSCINHIMIIGFDVLLLVMLIFNMVQKSSFKTVLGYKYEESDESISESSLYTPLNGEANDISKSDSVGLVTPFAKAGFFCKISFWWLNSLMKKGREKTLVDEDIPKLREADQAESCYLLFLEQLNKQKQKEPSSQPSILRTIIVCHWKEILMSGFFALLKILTLSAGPVFLNAFILVAEGKESFKKVEYKWLSAVQLRKAYNGFLFWSSPVLVSAATFGACYFLKVPLHANNVFTFEATLRLVQDPVISIPDIIGVVIQAKVAFERILKFLEAPELQSENVRRKTNMESVNDAIVIKSANFSWEENSSKPTLKNINLEIRPGEKVAICGEVGSGKSTLLAAILGEVPTIQGTVLEKCQLNETVKEKEKGLDSLGKLMEYDEPMKLMKREGSLFGQLVKEYWSHSQSAESHSI